MATTYLVLCNLVLNKMNEVVLTSSNFTSDRGIQTAVKDAVNEAIQDTCNAELEWPFLYAAGTQLLVPGTQVYSLPSGYSDIEWETFFIQTTELLTNGAFTSAITSWSDVSAGSGTAAWQTGGYARLTGDGTDAGAVEQAVTCIANKPYRVQLRHLTGDVAYRVGTTSGGTEITSGTATLDNAGDGETFSFTFTPTASTVYLGFYNTSTTAIDLDYVKIKRDENPRKLNLLGYDEWHNAHRSQDRILNDDAYQYPRHVFATKNDEFGVSPIPDFSDYTVDFNYWTVQSDLSAHGDTMIIPDQFKQVVAARARQIVYNTRSDPAFYDRAKKQYDDGLADMRTKLITKSETMFAR